MISFGGMSIIGIRPTDWGANFTRNRKARAHFVVINQGVYQFYMSSDTRKFSMLFENASLKFNASCYMKVSEVSRTQMSTKSYVGGKLVLNSKRGKRNIDIKIS